MDFPNFSLFYPPPAHQQSFVEHLLSVFVQTFSFSLLFIQGTDGLFQGCQLLRLTVSRDLLDPSPDCACEQQHQRIYNALKSTLLPRIPSQIGGMSFPFAVSLPSLFLLHSSLVPIHFLIVLDLHNPLHPKSSKHHPVTSHPKQSPSPSFPFTSTSKPFTRLKSSYSGYYLAPGFFRSSLRSYSDKSVQGLSRSRRSSTCHPPNRLQQLQQSTTVPLIVI